jgi:transposase
VLQAQLNAWRTEFFVFLQHRRVSATNNIAEPEVRPSVLFRKVTGGFRSPWDPTVHAGYRSVASTARIAGQTAFNAMRAIADTLFTPARHAA